VRIITTQEQAVLKNKCILSLICFARKHFSEQCDEKLILS